MEVIGLSDSADGNAGGPDAGGIGGDGRERPARLRNRTAAVLGLLLVAAVFVQLTGGGDQPTSGSPANDEAGGNGPSEVAELNPTDRLDALVTAGSLPPELVAAEVYRAAPGPDTLRHLLRTLGGVEGVTVAETEGSFDLVSFDPTDHDRLAASRRSGYGPAQNQDVNEAWLVAGDGTLQTSLLSPIVEHDFAHYNDSGDLSFWTHAGDDTVTDDFAPRTVSLVTYPYVGDHRSDPLQPSRAVVVGGTLFALTGDGDYYSTSRKFESLIADRGRGQILLDDGAEWAWVDNPTPGVIVAYPREDEGATGVWSTDALERIDDHQLAGHPYRRLAVSGDLTTMVGVTFDGVLEVTDIGTNRVTGRFGRLNADGISAPITLNHDGTIAVTVDNDGTVTIWWVGDPDPIAVVDGDAGPPRVVSEYRAPRVSSAVAAGATRVAVRNRAQPTVATTWTIIETDPARWVEMACDRAGRSMTPGERVELGLEAVPAVCSG